LSPCLDPGPVALRHEPPKTDVQIIAQAAPTPPDCPPGPPPALDTLVDVTRWRANQQPNDPAYIFLVDGEEQEQRLSYAELDRRARLVAAELQARGLEGQRVLLVMNPGLEYNTAIFGCLYAGVVAVPVYPPDPFRAHRTLPRLQAIVRDAQAAVVLSGEEILQWARPMIENTCGRETLAIEPMLRAEGNGWTPAKRSPRQLALLQYTSGSTGEPKGVMLTHRNLMHNLAALHRLDKPGAVAVCWVPPYHDMGLIGAIMLPAHSGRPVVLMSPLAFMQRPVRWLRAISRFRACTSCSPNFGYELCIRKIRPSECEGLDLTSWAVAINGAEPVQADTLDRFVERFSPYGFRRETFYPAFGMAESTLLVTGGCRGDGPLVVNLSAHALENRRVEEVEEGGPAVSGATKGDSPEFCGVLPQNSGQSPSGSRRLVGCGRPVPQGEVAIVDPKTRRPLPPGAVGEIWVSSPSIARGYWNRPEETQRVFRARLAGRSRKRYLRTGDLGFTCRGQLFVAGRLKELIILGGRNYYPHDIERTAQRAHPALKPDGGAALSIENDGEERLVVVHEVLRPKAHDLQAVLGDLRREVTEEYEWSPHAVV
jgi:acyl-CoA synthetase (AMP-forming)/AMP-acid ligase II